MALRKRAIIATIEADCEIRARYANDAGETCAIGGLAKAAHVPFTVLLAAGDGNIALRRDRIEGAGERLSALQSIRTAITKRFGLTVAQMTDIQRINDTRSTQWERREAIVAYIKSL